MENSIQINAPVETPEETEKPRKPVCEFFERQPERPPVWCNNCGRHKNLHSAGEYEEAEETAPVINPRDPFGFTDRDSYNAIYKGGNSSPFPYESDF